MRGWLRVGVGLLVVLGLWRSWIASPHDDLRPHTVVVGGRTSPVAARPDSGPAPSASVVPSVVGLSGSYAEEVLRVAGLRLGGVRFRGSSRPWGTVLSQSVAAGTPVGEAAAVQLVLVRGSVRPCWPSWCRMGRRSAAASRV